MPTTKRRSVEPSVKRRPSDMHITVFSTLLIATISGMILFFFDPGVSKAANVTGQIIGTGAKCLDNNNGRLINKNEVTLRSCNNSSAQKWTIPGDGTIREGDYCLDIPSASTKTKTKIQLYKCNGTKAQQWTFEANSSIVSSNSELCLDSQSGKITDGNPVWMWSCNSTAAQKWTLPKVTAS